MKHAEPLGWEEMAQRGPFLLRIGRVVKGHGLGLVLNPLAVPLVGSL